MSKSQENARTPYNFIPFPKKPVFRYNDFSELPSYNKKNEKLKTGWVEYKVITKSPLFIGSDSGGFFKINEEYKIPGSTIKGRIRANAEIISQAQPQFIENQKLWYRFLGETSKELRDEYTKNLKNISLIGTKNTIEEFVKVGYLRKIGSRYEIIEAKKDKKGFNFQKIKESKLRKMEINKENVEGIFMYKNIDWENINKLKKNKNTKEISKLLNQDKKNNENAEKGFKPYSMEVYYKTDNNGIVIDISKKSKEGWEIGYLSNSSNLGNKQTHYLVFEKDNNKRIKVPKEIISQFKVNIKHRNNHERRHFDIEDTVEKFGCISKDLKPVFYQMDKYNNVKVIGFTPYLKIPYKYSVLEGIKNLENKKIDYIQGLFGMIKPQPYKSRLIFDNLTLEENRFDKSNPVKLSLYDPKPTSFQLYIKQNLRVKKKLMTYNDNDFKLNGYKFYYLKKKPQLMDDSKEEYNKEITPIENAVFKGKIYFKNLYDDELGLLLMAIAPVENGMDLLGQGKPYGFGKVKINVDKVYLNKPIEIENKNESEIIKLIQEIEYISKTQSFDGVEKTKEIDNYKNIFKEKLEELSEIPIFKPENETIKALSYSKTVEVDAEKNRYMKRCEFKERKVLKPI